MENSVDKWKVYAKKANFDEIGEKYGVDPVVARIVRNRDVIDEKSLDMYFRPDLNKIHSPYLMKDIENACEIIEKAIANNKKIEVVGDYDIDGVCSGNILVQGLEELGADVVFDVPDRIEDGYGINQTIIKKAYDSGIELIVTCDNGIAAIDAVDYAKNIGLEIVVTDHHEIHHIEEGGEVKYLIPNADAVINPKQPDDEYPFREMCGAGVAYKLIWALFDRKGYKKEQWEKYLELVAIATIGDVVELVDENRIMTIEGLKKLNNTRNLGLKKLIEKTELEGKKIASYHIGFVLGPCLNAGGRLDSAKKSFELLHTRDINRADVLAIELKKLNDERKEMTNDGVKRVVDIIETDNQYKNENVLVVYVPDCHESIVGIIAGRIREKYNKPVFVLTDAKDGIKGSGRSIEEYNMFEELVKCRYIFQKFGGHPMAAGISLEKGRFDELRMALNNNSKLTEEDLCRKIWIDVPMPFDYITYDLVKQLEKLEPFGKGNEKPSFAQKNVRIGKISVFGKNRNVLALDMYQKNGFSIRGTMFCEADAVLDDLRNKFSDKDVNNALNGKDNNIDLSIQYYPQINEFNGKTNLQVVINRYL